MANPATGYTNDSSNRGAVVARVIGTSDNPASNLTTITWSIAVVDGNGSTGGYNLNSPSGTGGRATGNLNISPGGFGTLSGSASTSYNGGYGTYDFGSGYISSPVYPKSSGTITATITHTSGGAAGPVYVSGSFTGGNGPAGNASASTSSISITTFTPPSVPNGISLNRTNNGTEFTASASGSSGGSLPNSIDYVIEWAYEGGSWTTYGGSTSTDNTRVIYLRAYARSGTSYDWQRSGYSGILAVGYAAPSISSTTTAGPTATVTVSPASSNGGNTVSYHVVQASTYSDFSSVSYTNTLWGESGGSTTFSYLTPGQTWYFRAYAVNQAGVTSPVSSSTNVFVSAYGEVAYSPDGTTVSFRRLTSGKRRDASGNWATIAISRKYTGGQWVPFQ
jgi:hypothetical protein